MIRTAEWKYVDRYPDGPHELYDVVNDPDDRDNLIDDPAHADRVEDLKKKMETWFQQYVIPDMDGRMYNVAGYGQLRVGAKREDGHAPFDGAAVTSLRSQFIITEQKTQDLMDYLSGSPVDDSFANRP